MRCGEMAMQSSHLRRRVQKCQPAEVEVQFGQIDLPRE
jgi:hypothetical protein